MEGTDLTAGEEAQETIGGRGGRGREGGVTVGTVILTRGGGGGRVGEGLGAGLREGEEEELRGLARGQTLVRAIFFCETRRFLEIKIIK